MSWWFLSSRVWDGGHVPSSAQALTLGTSRLPARLCPVLRSRPLPSAPFSSCSELALSIFQVVAPMEEVILYKG